MPSTASSCSGKLHVTNPNPKADPNPNSNPHPNPHPHPHPHPNQVYALNGIELLGRKLHVNRSREYEVMADEVKEDLKRHGLLGSTSVSVDGAPVFGADLPDPEEKSAQQVVVANPNPNPNPNPDPDPNPIPNPTPNLNPNQVSEKNSAPLTPVVSKVIQGDVWR